MAEDVYIKYGRYEVLPGRMRDYVRQQEMNDAEIDRCIKARAMHLDWYQRHFAHEILPPPEGEEEA